MGLEGIQVADGRQTYVLVHHLPGLILKILQKEVHEGADLLFRTKPVFNGKGIEGEAADPDPAAGFRDDPDGFGSLPVSQDSAHGMALGPASVAVHDDCDMLGKFQPDRFLS